MPIFHIAFASGFESLRRFNEAFKQRFTISPTEMRTHSNSILDSGLELKIPVRLPYDWKSVISYLKRHECYGLETIVNDTFHRFIPNKKNFGEVIVSDKTKEGFLNVRLINIPLEETRFVLSRIKNLFDTEHNPADLFSSQFLQPKGIRVPGSFDPFETSVSIILCQFVSTQHAKIKLETLVRKYGKKIGMNLGREVFRFPGPSILSQARIEEIGITKVKANAITELSKNVLKKTINFESFESFEQISDALLSIKGIGPWTASMILMRCFGNPDAFPKADLIIQRALEQNIVDQAQWISSRAYLTHCLWRDYSEVLSKKKKKVTR
jgi:AraC family transcriptional regulator of adaptative response / DNA-3-methyladenine glycosylase II